MIKKGREEEERKKGKKNEEMRVYLNPDGRGLSWFEEEFRRIRRSGYQVLEAERKKKKGGIAVNLTGTTFICFSHFFFSFLCLCCLRTHVRSLDLESDLYSVYFFGFMNL